MSVLSDYTNRRKYVDSMLKKQLRTQTVAFDVCKVDTSDVKIINNPFMVASTPAMGALAGTYTVTANTTTDDQLVVNKEVTNATHIFDFESRLSEFDLMAEMLEDLTAQNAILLDKWALNSLCQNAGSTYTTVAGGFTTSAKVLQIFQDLVGSVAGYTEAVYGKLFIVLESTEISGVLGTGATNGFTFADKTLYTGRIMNLLGVDIYPVRSGVFVTATVGGDAFTNSAKRVFGVKGMATIALPRTVSYEEKAVSGKTGRELVVYGYTGFKLWTPRAALVTRITVTP